MTAIQEIIAKCIAGDRLAQQQLFRLAGPKMLGLCRRYCKSEDDAHDALQEGFIKVFNSLEKYRGDSALDTWMGRIFINTAIDQYKKISTYGKMFDSLPDNAEAEDEVYEDNSFPCNAKEVLLVMDQMPEGYRVIFNLYCLEGFTHRQIAETLGISEGTSKSQYARAKKFIFDALVKKGVVRG
ncbi:MAG: sigma-70 family RNA polymerase sigma factor [Bacteroidetes bacterium]|nr:sigma-70 family RNA polymerase sigma factor [Bacteroidota bacterium]